MCRAKTGVSRFRLTGSNFAAATVAPPRCFGTAGGAAFRPRSPPLYPNPPAAHGSITAKNPAPAPFAFQYRPVIRTNRLRDALRPDPPGNARAVLREPSGSHSPAGSRLAFGARAKNLAAKNRGFASPVMKTGDSRHRGANLGANPRFPSSWRESKLGGSRCDT